MGCVRSAGRQCLKAIREKGGSPAYPRGTVKSRAGCSALQSSYGETIAIKNLKETVKKKKTVFLFNEALTMCLVLSRAQLPGLSSCRNPSQAQVARYCPPTGTKPGAAPGIHLQPHADLFNPAAPRFYRILSGFTSNNPGALEEPLFGESLFGGALFPTVTDTPRGWLLPGVHLLFVLLGQISPFFSDQF